MLSFVNGTPVSLEAIPTLASDAFRSIFTAEDIERDRKRVLALWKLPDGRLACVLGNPATHKLEVCATPAATYQPLRDEVPALHRFEAELRGEENLRPFMPLKGEAAHEVAVGPVHAGVIEPGHFRFQCMGETVHSLEIALGYQHRGVEKLMVEAKSDARRMALAETVAGDTSVAASLACARALQLPHAPAPLLNLALELERIANHVGDLGALAGDVAYLPTASFCGRIRGEYLNMTAELCGNRFGRGMDRAPMPSDETRAHLREWFLRTGKELFHATGLLFSEGSAIERFEGTGRVDAATARRIGLVGMAGRASGLAVDSRVDFPLEGEQTTVPLCGEEEMKGDVLARAGQRQLELLVAHARVRRLLSGAGAKTSDETPRKRAPRTLTVAVVEAWRGELVHLAVTGDSASTIAQYKIFDPSYHNWFGLAQALRGEQISNFPICNKSFNLSYCGVDR